MLNKTHKNKTTKAILTICALVISCRLTPAESPEPQPTAQIQDQLTSTPTVITMNPVIGDILQKTENWLEPTSTGPINDTATPSPTPLSTPKPQDILISIQPQSPVYLVNFLHPELGCNWMGIAGQIFNAKGVPVNGLIVEVEGFLGSEEVLRLALSGTSLQIGPGGFEITLSDRPFESQESLMLHIYDQNGKQLNETIRLTTYNDCRKNLILINFVLFDQPLSKKIFFPTIYR